MAAPQVFAERTTITGSIGVYAAFPNVAELATRYGVKMDIIKAGEVKDSGSMFHEMTPVERHLWQDMVDQAFDQFLAVVQEGRGKRLKYPLRRPIKEEMREIPGAKKGGAAAEGKVTFTRRLADGGVYTAEKAKAYGLVDQIGYLDDAVAAVRKSAGLPDDCNVILYSRPQSLWSGLFAGEESARQSTGAVFRRLTAAATPRLWYLAPQSDLAALLAAGSE